MVTDTSLLKRNKTMEMENTIKSEISHSFENSENTSSTSAKATNNIVEKKTDELASKVQLDTVANERQGISNIDLPMRRHPSPAGHSNESSNKKLVNAPQRHPATDVRIFAKAQSLDVEDNRSSMESNTLDESRPIYPNLPYSPYGSPYGSPCPGRRRAPLRESARISIEQSGSFVQLNQYKLLEQIGQGSYGLVKLAYSEEDSTHYAMKILSKRKLLKKAGLFSRGPRKPASPLDRVYKEIAVLKKLDHPNVVKLIEVLDDPLEDSLYLVFELVQQGEVLCIPTDQPMREERSWSVFRDCLLGLEYLHYQKIIHGDIKPGNLLLGEGGRVKIADLGVCNEFLGEDAAMSIGSTAGTPAFRAPETLHMGQYSYNGKAADIWALGTTLYALVFGNVPFVAKSIPAVYEKIKNDDIVYPTVPKTTPNLRDLFSRILLKDPIDRITLPQVKVHSWVTANGAHPLPSEEDNCRLIQISEEDMKSVVKSIPKLDTVILIKSMLKKQSFQNPFTVMPVSGRISQRGGSRLERFTRAGRSNSAPGTSRAYESHRQTSSDNLLPSVKEDLPTTSKTPIADEEK